MYNNPQRPFSSSNQPPQQGGDVNGGQTQAWGNNGSANQQYPWQGNNQAPQPGRGGQLLPRQNNQQSPQTVQDGGQRFAGTGNLGTQPATPGQFTFSGSRNRGSVTPGSRRSGGSQQRKLVISIVCAALALVVVGVSAFAFIANANQPNKAHLNNNNQTAVADQVTPTDTAGTTPTDTVTPGATPTVTPGVTPGTTPQNQPTGVPTKVPTKAPTARPTAPPANQLKPEPVPLIPTSCGTPPAGPDYPKVPYNPEDYHYLIDSTPENHLPGQPVDKPILVYYPPCDFCEAEVHASGWRCTPDFWTNDKGYIAVCQLIPGHGTMRYVTHAGGGGCNNFTGDNEAFDYWRHECPETGCPAVTPPAAFISPPSTARF